MKFKFLTIILGEFQIIKSFLYRRKKRRVNFIFASAVWPKKNAADGMNSFFIVVKTITRQINPSMTINYFFSVFKIKISIFLGQCGQWNKCNSYLKFFHYFFFQCLRSKLSLFLLHRSRYHSKVKVPKQKYSWNANMLSSRFDYRAVGRTLTHHQL